MRLTFKDGVFNLDDGLKNRQTLSLKAALRFRPYADKIAERVFNRTICREYSVPSYAPPSFLDFHQMEGVYWILTRSRSYLAHAPGAGKTAQAIVAAYMSGSIVEGTVLYIVPPSLCLNWVREIQKWSKRLDWGPGVAKNICIVPGSERQADMNWEADVIICPDSMLTKPWVYAALEKLKIRFVAVDEASRFKDPTAERTKALFGGVGDRVYYGLVQKARHAVLLDGSPMPNRPMELWAPCTAMDPASIEFLGMHEFGVKYCNAHFIADGYKLDWDYKGASNQEQLKRRLRKRFMHVVPEEALGHPERKRSMLFMDDVRTKEIKSWEQANVGKFRLTDIDENLSQGSIATIRQEIGLKKVPWVVAYIRERHESKNEFLLVFAWHRAVVGALANGLRAFRPGVVLGGTRPEERESIFRAFQTGRTRLIIGNISAMGRGHNLQRAKRVVFAEYSWTDELNKQAEKRASRKGASSELVRCDYIVVPNSMDEIILNSVFTKAKNVKRVIG